MVTSNQNQTAAARSTATTTDFFFELFFGTLVTLDQNASYSMTDVHRPKIRQFDFDGADGEIIGLHSGAAS